MRSTGGLAVPVKEADYPQEKADYLDLLQLHRSELYVFFRATVRKPGGEAVDKTCVIKVLDLELSNTSAVGSDTLSDVQKEVAVMRGCSHRNIVQLHTSFSDDNKVCVAGRQGGLRVGAGGLGNLRRVVSRQRVCMCSLVTGICGRTCPRACIFSSVLFVMS